MKYYEILNISKGFTKVLKAYIKHFEAPKKSVKIKIQLNFFLLVRDWDGEG